MDTPTPTPPTTPTGITATTRRIVAVALAVIVFAVVVAITALVWIDAPGATEVATALVSIAATAVGGLAAMVAGVSDGS